MTAAAIGSGAGLRRIALPVNEVFGPVPQGEGPYAGRCATFVRFGRCNLRCPPCDTPQTWDTSRFDLSATCPEETAAAIVRRAQAHGADDGITVVSGGEPLIWQRTAAWAAFLDRLPGVMHVETNGTIAPTGATMSRVDHFSVSPKIGAMGAADPIKRRIRPDVLAAFAALAWSNRACFKFVAGTPSDVHDVAELVDTHDLPRHAVWVMPLGESDEEWKAAGAAIVETAMSYRFNLSGRLHLTLGVR